MSKYEKCDFEDATHILLADGATVRDIKRIGYGCFKVANDSSNQRILDAQLFGAIFVREVVPEPFDKVIEVLTGKEYLGLSQYVGHTVRARIEVVNT